MDIFDCIHIYSLIPNIIDFTTHYDIVATYMQHKQFSNTILFPIDYDLDEDLQEFPATPTFLHAAQSLLSIILEHCQVDGSRQNPNNSWKALLSLENAKLIKIVLNILLLTQPLDYSKCIFYDTTTSFHTAVDVLLLESFFMGDIPRYTFDNSTSMVSIPHLYVFWSATCVLKMLTALSPSAVASVVDQPLHPSVIAAALSEMHPHSSSSFNREITIPLLLHHMYRLPFQPPLDEDNTSHGHYPTHTQELQHILLLQHAFLGIDAHHLFYYQQHKGQERHEEQSCRHTQSSSVDQPFSSPPHQHNIITWQQLLYYLYLPLAIFSCNHLLTAHSQRLAHITTSEWYRDNLLQYFDDIIPITPQEDAAASKRLQIDINYTDTDHPSNALHIVDDTSTSIQTQIHYQQLQWTRRMIDLTLVNCISQFLYSSHSILLFLIGQRYHHMHSQTSPHSSHSHDQHTSLISYMDCVTPFLFHSSQLVSRLSLNIALLLQAVTYTGPEALTLPSSQQQRRHLFPRTLYRVEYISRFLESPTDIDQRQLSSWMAQIQDDRVPIPSQSESPPALATGEPTRDKTNHFEPTTPYFYPTLSLQSCLELSSRQFNESTVLSSCTSDELQEHFQQQYQHIVRTWVDHPLQESNTLQKPAGNRTCSNDVASYFISGVFPHLLSKTIPLRDSVQFESSEDYYNSSVLQQSIDSLIIAQRDQEGSCHNTATSKNQSDGNDAISSQSHQWDQLIQSLPSPVSHNQFQHLDKGFTEAMDTVQHIIGHGSSWTILHLIGFLTLVHSMCGFPTLQTASLPSPSPSPQSADSHGQNQHTSLECDSSLYSMNDLQVLVGLLIRQLEDGHLHLPPPVPSDARDSIARPSLTFSLDTLISRVCIDVTTPPATPAANQLFLRNLLSTRISDELSSHLMIWGETALPLHLASSPSHEQPGHCMFTPMSTMYLTTLLVAMRVLIAWSRYKNKTQVSDVLTYHILPTFDKLEQIYRLCTTQSASETTISGDDQSQADRYNHDAVHFYQQLIYDMMTVLAQSSEAIENNYHLDS